jgi:AraC-like DNA-binding protein/quercetin dioxygenase-like cupin family protein
MASSHPPSDTPRVPLNPNVPGLGVAIKRFTRDGARCVGRHHHEHLQILYMEQGGGSHWIASRRLTSEAGDAYLIGPGVAHDFSDPGTEGWSLSFTSDALEPAGGRPLEDPGALDNPGTSFWLGLQKMCNPEHACFQVPAAERTRWTARLTAIRDELERPQPGQHEAVRALLVLLTVQALRFALPEKEWPQKVDPLVRSVFDVIAERYDRPLSLSDVANALGLSAGYLTTRIRQRTGKTVQAWITERRMIEARRRLQGTDEPVARVGEQVGYGDPTHFIRLFRRAHGQTPSAWRRQSRLSGAFGDEDPPMVAKESLFPDLRRS